MKSLKIFFASFITILNISCSKDKVPEPVDVDPGTKVTKVELNVSDALLLPSATKKLSFTISPANADDMRVNWSSTNTNIATVDTSGLVTAIAKGDAMIIASSVGDPSRRDTTRVTILSNYTVYAVGVEYMPMMFKRGLYWLNQEHHELQGNLSIASEINAIKLSGDDVYIAGVTINGNNWAVPTLWKNSIASELTATNLDVAHYVTGIDVAGSDVYVTGWDFDLVKCPDCQYVYHGHCWKNSGGTVTDLKFFDDSSSSAALSVSVKNSKLYVSGWQANDNFFRRSKLWVNDFAEGKEFTANSFSNGNALLVKGNDVYVAGFDGCPDFGCIQSAWLWKNDGSSPLQVTSGVYESSVAAIAALGDDIVMAGYEKNSAGKFVAKYWILSNGKLKEIQVGTGETDSEILAMQVVGNELFLAGYESEPINGYRQAKYWRSVNGISLGVDLLAGLAGTRNTQLNGIAVK